MWLLSAALIVASPASAGPWVRPPGHWYLKASGATWRGDVEGVGSYLDWTASAYAEVGVLPHLQLVADVPYRWCQTQAAGATLVNRTAGFAKARVGVGVAPVARVPVSAHVIANLPLYDAAAAPALPSLGDDQVDVDGILAVGASPAVGQQRLWFIAEAGYRHRTSWAMPGFTDQAFVDGALYRAQVGLVPEVGGRSWGWVFVEASGLAKLKWDLDTAAWHQAGLGVAAPLGAGLHVELGASEVYAAVVGSTGWGVNLGLSHRRDG